MSIVQTAEFIVPSDPAVLKRIKDLCIELSSSMCRSEGERDFQSEAIKDLSKDTEIPAKFLRKAAKLYHKSNRDLAEQEGEISFDLYDKVFGPIGE